ncbi:MAG: hypothetical protein ACRDHE_01175 [Ktedonobacterales bacterium]
MPEDVRERLLATEPLDGLARHEASSFRHSLADLRALGADALAARVEDILSRYDAAEEQSEGEGIMVMRWRDCGLTVADRACCEEAARLLREAGHPARLGERIFTSVANRLWELRGPVTRPSPLAG